MKNYFWVCFFVILTLLYSYLTILCIQLIVIKRDRGGFFIWLSTFLISLFIILIMVKIRKRNIFLKSIIMLVIGNLFVGFILFLLSKLLRGSSFELFLIYLFCVGIVFSTGNWILPILFIVAKKRNAAVTHTKFKEKRQTQ